MKVVYWTFGEHKLYNESIDYLTNFLRDTPVYSEQPLTPEMWQSCCNTLCLFGLKFDTWCVQCKKESTFELKPMLSASVIQGLENQAKINASVTAEQELDQVEFRKHLRWLSFVCAREEHHRINYVCVFEIRVSNKEGEEQPSFDRSIVKIGQQPALADIAIAEARKYSKELDSEYFKEFNRAIGLASHNVGIGSFVYLRRIIEKLVVQAGQENLEAGAFADFSGQRFRDKIQTVKQWVPDCLTSNKHLYSILSKAIHELEEKECLAAFEPCKTAIEIILDEHIAKNEADKKKATLEGTLKKLNEDL